MLVPVVAAVMAFSAPLSSRQRKLVECAANVQLLSYSSRFVRDAVAF